MADQNTDGTGSTELQRKAAEQARDAVAAQHEIADKLVREQQAIGDRLTREELQRQHDRYVAWCSDQTENRLVSAEQHEVGLPTRPLEPALLRSDAQRLESGKTALAAYKEAGFIAHRDTAPVAANAQSTAADYALAEERAFRERQQHLADKIADPKTDAQTRERLELQRAAEYHDHHAETWDRVADIQRHLGTGDSVIANARNRSDHHKEQAALAADGLHRFDSHNQQVPLAVEKKLEKQQHDTTPKKGLSDPHTNSAYERALTRRETGARRDIERSPALRGQIEDAKAREAQIDAERQAQGQAQRPHQRPTL